jgi:predicted Ser/Thr protein kinase
VLNGRYRLTQRIAAGGMGEVWRGDDLLLHREIAVKVLLPALMSDSEFITRFRSEARMMAALRHPGIVQVYDYGENAQVGAHGLDYLVMEFIDGTPLSAKIRQAGRLSPAETMAAVAQVADALQAAHDAGIIHRDVKPSNLLVRPAGAIVLVDFGVARSTGIAGITSTNVVLGSAHYMAPEQAEGRPVTPVTDVYAVGAVAFTCLTGRPPYVGDNPLAVLGQLVHGQPPVLPPDVPPAVAGVVLRALAKDPAQRFPSAAALAAAALGAGAALSQPAAAAGSATGPGFTPGSATAGRGTAAGPHGFAPGSASVGAAGHGPAGGPAAGGVTGHGIAGEPATGGTTGQGIAAEAGVGDGTAAVGRRRNVTVALAAAAVVALMAGVGIIIGNQLDKPGQVTGAQDLGSQEADLQDLGSQGEQVQAGAGSDKPRGQVTGRPRTSPKGGVATEGTAPAGEDPTATGQPSATATTDPDETGDPSATEPATNPYADPVGICGDGYQVIDSKKLKSTAGVLRGTIYLLYLASDATNCVVTIKANKLDQKTAMSAALEVQGTGAPVSDTGNFQYYAGPVRAAAPKTCVKWGGAISGISFESGFSHCG